MLEHAATYHTMRCSAYESKPVRCIMTCSCTTARLSFMMWSTVSNFNIIHNEMPLLTIFVEQMLLLAPMLVLLLPLVLTLMLVLVPLPMHQCCQCSSLSLSMHIYIYRYYICVYVYVYVYLYVYVRVHVYIYIYIYIHMPKLDDVLTTVLVTWYDAVCRGVCVYIYIYMCVYRCIYVYIYIYIYLCAPAADPWRFSPCGAGSRAVPRFMPVIKEAYIFTWLIYKRKPTTRIYIYIYIFIDKLIGCLVLEPLSWGAVGQLCSRPRRPPPRWGISIYIGI